MDLVMESPTHAVAVLPPRRKHWPLDAEFTRLESLTRPRRLEIAFGSGFICGPNPFNPATTIRFLAPGAGASRPVRLAIYDVEGRLVRELVDGPFGTGEQAVRWDGRTGKGGRAASGAYFMKLEVAGSTLTGKLVLLQ
jgi:hypothetical protein